MTRRERVLAAIAHQTTDFVPYQIDFTKPAYQNVVKYTGDANFFQKIGNHVCGASYGGMVEVRPNYFRDYFGVVWNRTVDKDIGVVEEYPLREPTLDGFTWPELDEAELRANCERALADSDDMCKVFFLGFSMFERAWILRGMENLLTDMVAEPGFVHDLLERICEFNLKIIDISLEYPFDGHYFGDDWGQQSGLIMGQNHWQTFIKPRMARMYERVKAKGRFVVQHSCGDIHELFSDLIEIGLDAYQTFQPEIYDIKAVKGEYGQDLTFWGGISTQQSLPYITPDDVKKLVHETIQVLGKSGGYICGPTHAIPGDVPPENIVALVEALQNQ